MENAQVLNWTSLGGRWVFVSLCAFSALLAFIEYSAARAVYVGHFGNSLEYDWAMRPWYLTASAVFAVTSVLSALMLGYLRPSLRLRAIIARVLISIFLVALAVTELAMPYWYKHVKFLNYGQGG